MKEGRFRPSFPPAVRVMIPMKAASMKEGRFRPSFPPSSYIYGIRV